MDEQLNAADLDLILESLKYYKMNIENYDRYPSYEFKQKQLQRVEIAESKLRILQRKLAQE